MRIFSLIPVALLAAAAYGHYTWITPETAFVAGKPVTIRIGHGHAFPNSEETINAAQLDLFVVTPSGKRVPVKAAAAVKSVTASYTPTESGPHTIAFVQDRGVSSRTPKGLKKGGRDVNPDALTASRTLRTSVAAGGVTGARPLGLEVELTAQFASGAWNVRLLTGGKPHAGAAVEVFLAGASSAAVAGKTDTEGKIRYQPPAGAAKPALFLAEFKNAAPRSAAYDAVNYETSLFVSW
ncbi:MAG: DUF4198 domain-containing protein [Acidobacteria bacterium]|nr:DUF4198 domain-containing protein [Acidobacteriota bacterium]